MFAALILLSVVLLFAPIVLGPWNSVRAPWSSRVFFALAVLLSLPLINVWISFFEPSERGDGWQQLMDLVLGFAVSGLANGAYWLGRKFQEPEPDTKETKAPD